MLKIKDFVGVDLSKEVFDAVLLKEGQPAGHRQFENTVKGCRSFVKWLQKEGVEQESVLVCAEHTGMYQNILAAVLTDKGLQLWIEMSYRIIRSSGIQRGKTDKLDALRIAQYALRHVDQAILYRPKSEILQKVGALLRLREKLVKTKASLLRTVNEYHKFDKEASILLARHQRQAIRGIEKDIEKSEASIIELMGTDEDIKAKYKIAVSVPGVGHITALTLLCYTNAFQAFEKPRQLACYCGVVPFEYTSGKSIKGRPRVHHMANKKLKQLLHLGALAAVRTDDEIKTYYERKVEEGKSKMLVINNIRNKLIHRLCACIREERCYQVR